ncbi:hypothetical protein TNCV_2510981 [Trichonephila clavipes]|nr:hypothetical protein TNCV_2510981 [Trichonephila clavipes]
MIWGCMSSYGVGILHIVSGTVKAMDYIEILQNKLLPTARDLFGNQSWIFKDDNAPCQKMVERPYCEYNELIVWVRIKCGRGRQVDMTVNLWPVLFLLSPGPKDLPCREDDEREMCRGSKSSRRRGVKVWREGCHLIKARN